MTGRRTTPPKRGAIVLVPFPFAELTAKKARPTVVVSGARFFRAEGKIIVAAITIHVAARSGPTNFHLVDWQEAGLLKPSVITSWLATLSTDVILKKIGTLTKAQLGAFESALRAALEL